jgi:hypothetical protein
VKRSIDQAFSALRQQVAAWAQGEAKPGVRVFVYPPEWEAPMLSKFPEFARDCAAAGWPIALEDIGLAFLNELERRPGLADRLDGLERRNRERLLQDLTVMAERCVKGALLAPLDPPAVCRLLVNSGALGTFISYSVITNALVGDSDVTGPSALAFPGEGDERSLNLLRLRVDTNYRVPRI